MLGIHINTYRSYKDRCLKLGYLKTYNGILQAVSIKQVIEDLGLTYTLLKAKFFKHWDYEGKLSLGLIYQQIKISIWDKNIRQQAFMDKTQNRFSSQRKNYSVSGKYHVAKLLSMSSSTGTRLLRRQTLYSRQVSIVNLGLPAFDDNVNEEKRHYKGSFILRNSNGTMMVYKGSKIYLGE